MGFWYTYGCLSSLVGIAIGAAGGHKKEWDAERKEVFHKATFYHFMNNVGILVGIQYKYINIIRAYLLIIFDF